MSYRHKHEHVHHAGLRDGRPEATLVHSHAHDHRHLIRPVAEGDLADTEDVHSHDDDKHEHAEEHDVPQVVYSRQHRASGTAHHPPAVKGEHQHAGAGHDLHATGTGHQRPSHTDTADPL